MNFFDDEKEQLAPPPPTTNSFSDFDDELETKSFPWKKIAITGGVLLALSGIGFGGFTFYKAKQEQAAIQAKEESEKNQLLASLEVGVKTFSLSSYMEEQSTWDLNKNYAKTKLVLSFLEKLSAHISVKSEGDTVLVTYPNWTFLKKVLLKDDAWEVLEKTKELKPSDHEYVAKVEETFLNYFISNIDAIMEQRDDYVSELVQTMSQEEPNTLVLEVSASDWKDGNKISKFFSDELDKAVFGDAFRSYLDAYSTLVSGAYGELTPLDEYTKWKSEADKLLTYISGLRDLYADDLPSDMNFGEHIVLPNGADSAETEGLTDVNSSLVSPFWQSENNTVLSALEAYRNLIKVKPKPYEIVEKGVENLKIIPHSLAGVNFIQSNKSDAASTSVQRGDGSFDAPYTLGTPFVTKALSTDGNYYNVKVTLTKVLTGQEAIEDVLVFDEKNQGFTLDSEFKLATIHFTVENLEDKDIVINSEWSLSDKDLNLVPRTGSMFSFKERVELPKRGTVEMSDWTNARETLTAALVWGKTFNRAFPAVFVNALGNEVFSEIGDSQDRNVREEVALEAQEHQKSLEEQVETSQSGGQ